MHKSGLLHALPTPTSLLMEALRRFPDRVAFGGSDAITYAALEDTIARFQAVLVGRQVRPERSVAILSKNRWDAWAAACAVSALGAAPCWLHPLGTAATHAEQVMQVDPTGIIVDADAFPDRVEVLREVLPGVPIFVLGAGMSGTDLHAAAQHVGAVRLRDMSHPDGLGMVGLTGGTTGKSKAVGRAMGSVASMAIATIASFEIPPTPRFLAIGPISHVTGVKILPTLMLGGTVIMVDRFDPESALRQIETERISFTLAVPTMIYDALDHPALDRFDTSSLKLLLYGGAAMSPSRLAEGLHRIGPVFSQLYGQAECHPIAVLDITDHDLSRPEILAACGFPARGCTVKIMNEAMEEVDTGETGEICVRSPGVMIGYMNSPQETEEALAGGWLHTGDIGRRDEEGRLSIVDRKKDMIVSGGFNVFPREIEDVLTSHPDIAAAAVIGLPDARWGEAVHAVLTLRHGAELDEAALAQFVRTAKGSMMTPKSFLRIDEMPLTAAGKIDKRSLVVRVRAGEA